MNESIAYIAKSAIENSIPDDSIDRIEWSIAKQQRKEIDFLFDPAKKKEIEEQEKASRGEKPNLSAPPKSKVISR